MPQLSPAADGDPVSEDKPIQQVFYSEGARRGWVLLIVLVFLACLAAVIVLWAREQVNEPPPTAVRYNTSVDYPRQTAAAVLRCAERNGQYGATGHLQVPVIGAGVFRRVVRIVPDGSVRYAVDPFTSQVIRPLTALEAHSTRSCRYAVDEFGTVPPHTIVLTYDDAPSARWTPQLVGLLGTYHVHATFFALGVNIIAGQQAFRAVVGRGDAVGNSVFEHPQPAQLSDTAARSELTENARIMAEVADYQTRVWGVPADDDPASVGQGIFATLVGQQLGFTEVGLSGDSPEPELSPGPHSRGELISMTDSGGTRASTVVLSARLLKEATSLGYRFMTVPQLLARQPGFSGPVTSRVEPTAGDYAAYWLHDYNLPLMPVYQDCIWYLMAVILVISGLILMGAALDRWLSYRRPPQWQPAELGVLIPCWKESKVIRNTVERVLAVGAELPFPLRIVLVDDGSADNDPDDTTWEVMGQLAAEYPAVTAVAQTNGGKARALNYGLAYVTSEIVVVMDADTIPQDAQSFLNLVRWFGDPRMGAVAGWIRGGGHGKGWWQHAISQFQAAEYDLGIALVRSVQNLTNGIVIVPGAFAAFRTEWLAEVGYLPDRVAAEDAEAVQRMRRIRPRLRIRQDLTAVAYTEMPLTFEVLRKQWRRWTIGVLQTLSEHREVFYRPDRYRLLTLQWWFALYGNVVPPLFLPLSYGMVIYGLATGTTGDAFYYPVVFIAFRVVQTISAMIILRSWMNPLVAIWYRLINDPLQIYLTIVCFWMILTGRMPSTRKIWSQVPRSGELGTVGIENAGGQTPRTADPLPEPVALLALTRQT